jgi:hypothetical protein
MDIIIFQIFLGIGLFFIINWIGKHSYSIGYMGISIFVKTEEAPALNFLIRVLTPIVFIIIVSAILYYCSLDKYVRDIYMVNVYYIVFRLVFNLITARGLLLNWKRQFLYWVAIIVVSFFTYDKLIKVKANILPDFSTIANEVWIIVLVFIFQISNNIRVSQDETSKRKQNYIKSRYLYFKQLYGKTISEITKNDVLESITYAILIYEDFNRPKLARLIENVKFRLTKTPHTLGVMQVYTHKYLTDMESVILGTKKIVNAYNTIIAEAKEQNEDYNEWRVILKIIEDYNIGSSYSYEVSQLADSIKDEFYKNSIDSISIEKK